MQPWGALSRGQGHLHISRPECASWVMQMQRPQLPNHEGPRAALTPNSCSHMTFCSEAVGLDVLLSDQMD